MEIVVYDQEYAQKSSYHYETYRIKVDTWYSERMNQGIDDERKESGLNKRNGLSQQQQTRSFFQDVVPIEIVAFKLLHMLDFKDICNFESTCKCIKSVSAIMEDVLWRNLLLDAFGVKPEGFKMKQSGSKEGECLRSKKLYQFMLETKQNVIFLSSLKNQSISNFNRIRALNPQVSNSQFQQIWMRERRNRDPVA